MSSLIQSQTYRHSVIYILTSISWVTELLKSKFIYLFLRVQEIAVVACDEFLCLVIRQILQLGYFWIIVVYFIHAVICEIWKVFNNKRPSRSIEVWLYWLSNGGSNKLMKRTLEACATSIELSKTKSNCASNPRVFYLNSQFKIQAGFNLCPETLTIDSEQCKRRVSN
jgi:hypothetical protein